MARNRTQADTQWVVGNNRVRLVLAGAEGGGLAGLTDLETGRDFIAGAPAPLYRLTLARQGEDPIELTSAEAESVEVSRTTSAAGETLTLAYGAHRGQDIRVTCTLWLAADSPLSEWRIEVRNGTSYGIRAIRYPVVLAPAALGDSGDDDCFIWGNFGGEIIERPREKMNQPLHLGGHWWCRAQQYPGPVAVQMQAYYDRTAGLYIATYDDAGYIKAFSLRSNGETFDLSVEHNYDERPGLSFRLPYATIIGVFHGDWHAAANIYKEWAQHQHWCARPLTERDDIPAWAKEPRPSLAVASRGDIERFRGTLNSPPAEWPLPLYWPAHKVVPRIRKYAEIFRSPVITWMEGWEQIGSPGGPVDIFPPYEGEESFRAAMSELNLAGSLVYMYLAGLHWCFKRAMTGYDGWERFEREGRPLAALNARGEIDKEMFLNAQKQFVPLCIGSQRTRELYIQNLLKLQELGATWVQIDQQLGMYSQVCYSTEHGHAPGYGPWMYQTMREFIRQARLELKQRLPEAAFSYESPCEVWLQETDLHMDRPYMLGFVPLFDYLYHEYALLYGGDAMMGLCHPDVEVIQHAMVFVYGCQHLGVIGLPEWDYEVNGDYAILQLLPNTCAAQRTYARDYLVFGQMLEPTGLEATRARVDIWKPTWVLDNSDPGSVEIPAVFHSAWRSPQGKIGYVLVNWTGTPQKVTLALREMDVATPLSLVSAESKAPVPPEQLTEGRVCLSVPARDVVLVEQG